MIDFKVKVYRHYEDDISNVWDSWFFSKVYAINGNEFLVYDDGNTSAWCTEEDFCPTGFTWVDFTETVPVIGKEEAVHLKVELVEEEQTE